MGNAGQGRGEFQTWIRSWFGLQDSQKKRINLRWPSWRYAGVSGGNPEQEVIVIASRVTVLQLHILSCVRQPDTVVLVATVRPGVQLYPVTSAKDLRHETGATQQLPVTRPHERDRMCNRITAHARSSDYNLVRALPRHPRCDERMNIKQPEKRSLSRQRTEHGIIT